MVDGMEKLQVFFEEAKSLILDFESHFLSKSHSIPAWITPGTR